MVRGSTHTEKESITQHTSSFLAQIWIAPACAHRTHNTPHHAKRKHFSYSQIKPYISMKNIEKFQILKWKKKRKANALTSKQISTNDAWSKHKNQWLQME